ncbi:MlaD family protein [Mycobacterium arosiense]|uniref:Mammalian cell entry protein n=1 Tax=Mycobacterium arosiense ATCC BAA-1401 = DSM 45069 TaxID=1265311 RepID=A0A1W9ZBL0_MYCAI|nr:MlaD family protein [Mycobacterium arosiense]ORA11287.1 mammalian cell entry protein [Mycobacterium arosiense ATCC BAA-1401 = DSM 45069]
MKIRYVMSFIAFGLAIAFGVYYIGSLGVRLRPPSNRTDLSMTVPDINGLVVDANVLLRGVPVGKVTKIQSAVAGATVDFFVESRFRVPVDTEVQLENLSALGESYIELVPRSQNGPMLHSGQHIATNSVRQPPSISELASSVVRVLNQLDPDQLKRITVEADTALPYANSVLPNLSHASRVLRNAAAGMHGNGRVLLDNFQSLLHNAGFMGPVLTHLGPQLFNILEDAQSILGNFFLLIHNGAPNTMVTLSHLVSRIQRLLDNNGGDLKVLGEAFLPQITKIAGALMNFDAGQILSNMLDSVPEDGRVTLHVTAQGS